MARFERISYGALNARQKENFNFQKFAARLADYGFNCLRLSDDWHGADFIACHIDGDTFLKVQLKGRFIIDKKYIGKSIHMAFIYNNRFYLYPHDDVHKRICEHKNAIRPGSFSDETTYSWPYPPKAIEDIIAEYEI